jgi:hypothetical protein
MLFRKPEAVNLRNVGLVFSFVFLFVNVCAGRESLSPTPKSKPLF